MISLANGLIDICAKLSQTTMKCTQFKLGDKEINWISASIINYGKEMNMYNLPRGEGFLIYCNINLEDIIVPVKYLVKIGPDGQAKQFLDSDMKYCQHREFGLRNLYEDDRGNYCLSSTCARMSDGLSEESTSYIKLQSKGFQMEAFKNISKYDVVHDVRADLISKLILE
uniref:Uncharacterized protein n=1 Tax=Trichogramma kaykai TaxID=54128 RepID=A0ABD2X4S8_9HYME